MDRNWRGCRWVVCSLDELLHAVSCVVTYSGDCRQWQILIWTSGDVKGNKMSSVYRNTPTPHFELKTNHSILSELSIETTLNSDDDDDNDNNNNSYYYYYYGNLNLVRT